MEINFTISGIKITIGRRFFAGVIVVLFLISIIAVVGIKGINELEETSDKMLYETKLQTSAQILRSNFHQFIMPANDYLIHGNMVELKNFENLLIEVENNMKEFIKIAEPDIEKNILNNIDSYLNDVQALARKVFKLPSPIGSPEGAVIMEEMDAVSGKAVDEIDNILTVISGNMERYILANQFTFYRSKRKIIIVGLLVAMGMFIGGYFHVREIIKPLKNLLETTQEISSGNMSAKAKVKTNDELEIFAISFNEMLSELERTTIPRDYFNCILDRMVETLIITDSNGIIKTVNKSALTLLGYTEEEILGKTIALVVTKEGLDKVCFNNDAVKRFVEKEHVDNVYNTYFSKNGRAIPVVFSRSLIYNKKNDLLGMTFIAYNYSESHEEKELTLLKGDGHNLQNNIRAIGENPLTKRETEITKLLVMENSNREIAEQLFISVRTVETHRRNIMQKLHTKSVISLIHYATQSGLV